ncbi:MAG: hypothetical protein ACRECO_07085 [Xanthobacteraceae bacterium]
MAHTAIALPSFESYACAHDKGSFSRLLSELSLPQPETRFCDSRAELEQLDSFPFIAKAAVGTASRGTWMVQNRADLRTAIEELEAGGSFGRPVLVQDVVAGDVEHAQAVFCHGRLVASHAYRQIARGAGGGDAIKLSVEHSTVRSHLERIGAHLRWHGALSVDYIIERGTDRPSYIDCNPRLVEPMSALLAGLDLTDVLLRVSCGENPTAVPNSRPGVRTHISMQALLGCALRDTSRLILAAEGWRLFRRQGPYAGSREELTPVSTDWPSAVPVIAVAVMLLVRPAVAQVLPKKGWGAHLLNIDAIGKIERIEPHGEAPSCG